MCNRYHAAWILAALACCFTAPADAGTLNRLGRWIGIGWSDGYHVCESVPQDAGSILPPRGFAESVQATQRPRGALVSPPVLMPATTTMGDDCHCGLSERRSVLAPADTVTPPAVDRQQTRPADRSDRSAPEIQGEAADEQPASPSDRRLPAPP